MVRDAVRVREHVTAELRVLGIPGPVWAAVQALDPEERVARCRASLATLSAVESPGVGLDRDVAQALLALCWTLAVDAGLRGQIRRLLLTLSAQPDEEIPLNRALLVDLVSRAVQTWQ